MGRFLAACVTRFGPGGNAPGPYKPILAWQVWNEPNNKDFWGPAPDPGRFVRLMRQVSSALAPYRDRIKIVHAGLSKADLIYLWQLWEADPRYGETFDVMAVHPYIYDWRVGVRRPDDMDGDQEPDAKLGFVGDKYKPNYLGKVFNLQLFMTLRGSSKPIWITEMGFFVSRTRLGVSDQQQASLMADTLAFIEARLTDRPFGEGNRSLAANVQRVLLVCARRLRVARRHGELWPLPAGSNTSPQRGRHKKVAVMANPTDDRRDRRLTFRHVMALIYRRKLLALGFFISVLGGGYLALLAISPVYRSSAQVMVNLGQEDIFMPVLPSSSSEVRTPLSVGRLEQRANSEIRIIDSEPLAAQVVAKFGAAGLFPGIDERHRWYTPKGLIQRAVDLYRMMAYYFYPQSANETMNARAVRKLRENTKIVVVKDSTVIEITMDNALPDIAANALNELVRLYLQQRTALYQRETNDFFYKQLAAQVADLKEVDRQLDAFRSDKNVLDVDSQRETLLRRLADINANLQNETVAVGEIQKRIATLQRQMQDNVGISARIRDDLLKAQAELSARQEAASNWGKIRTDLTARIVALNKMQAESTQLLQRQRVLQDNRKLYLQKLEETRIQQAMRKAELGNVVVVNWAAADYSPVSPKLGMVLGGVLAVGLIGGLAFAFLAGLMDDRIQSAEDVEDASGLPVIGRVRTMRLAQTREA